MAKDSFLDLKARWGHPAWTQGVFPYFYSAFFARVLLALLLAAALLVIALRVRGLEAGVFASLAALLLLSPTLHPWYLLWVLPFAASRREPAFLYLSFCVPALLRAPLSAAGRLASARVRGRVRSRSRSCSAGTLLAGTQGG